MVAAQQSGQPEFRGQGLLGIRGARVCLLHYLHSLLTASWLSTIFSWGSALNILLLEGSWQRKDAQRMPKVRWQRKDAPYPLCTLLVSNSYIVIICPYRRGAPWLLRSWHYPWKKSRLVAQQKLELMICQEKCILWSVGAELD